METWYAVEYNYSKLESDKIFYKGRKEFDTFEELEKFVAVTCFLSDTKKQFDKFQQCQLFKKYFGREGKFAGLRKVYKYSKKEVPLVSSKNNCQTAINM